MNTNEIIAEIESLLRQLKESLISSGAGKNGKINQHVVIKKVNRQLSGLTGKINELAEDGFFKQPKTISDIQRKLKDGGVNKPTTSLMPPLLILLDRKILIREKPEKGVYKYYQYNV